MCIEQRRRARTETALVWLGGFRSRTNLRRVLRVGLDESCALRAAERRGGEEKASSF